MFTALVMKPFSYVKVHPVLEVKLGIAPANGMSHHEAKAGDVMEFETIGEFKEMEAVAAENDGLLVRQYRLGSNEFVYTPGIVKWACAHIKTDGLAVKRVIYSWAATKEMTPEQKAARPSKRLLDSLLKGEVKYAVEDEAVVFPVL